MKRQIYLMVLAFLMLVMPTGYAAGIKGTGPPVGEMKIAGLEECQPGDLVVLEANVPEGASLDWLMTPKLNSSFYIDTDKRTFVFASRKKGVYIFALAVAVEGKATCLIHVLKNGVGPDPNPPDPDPPEPDPVPDQKYQVFFFHDSNDLDNYTQDQRIMLVGLKFEEDLEKKGHNYLRSISRNSITETGKVNPELANWWRAAENTGLPCVAFAPLNGGKITVKPLPKTLDKFWEMIGEKP